MGIDRRQVLKIAAATPLLGATTAVADTPKTYLLVHGTWHGGWVWADVAKRLRAKGHTVFTPTLTGCGERIHLTGPDVGLETHIDDIANVLRYEGLSDVILIGHSFSGVPITGVADRMKEKIAHIVFFDALIPAGERMSGLAYEPDGSIPGWFQKRMEGFIDGYQMKFWDDYPIEMLLEPEVYPQAAELLRARITTHPVRGWTDRLELRHGGWKGLKRTCFHAVGQKLRPSSERMVGPGRGPGWDFIELDVPRDGMLTHPDLVAKAFLTL